MSEPARESDPLFEERPEHEAPHGRDTLGRVASDLAGNPVVAGLIERAASAKARADQLSTVALNQLNLPTAADVSGLDARLRSLSVRAERIEEMLEEVLTRLERLEAASREGRSGTGASAGGRTSPA